MPDPQRQELGRFMAECASRAPDFRWTPVENLHLTVRFVGSVNGPVVESVAEALTGRALTSFEIALGGVGTFGRGRATRVVWLGLREGGEAAAALAEEVEAECVRSGLAGEDRPYQAHVTLARARARAGSKLPDIPAVPELEPWRARELVLYSSRLTKSGAIYGAIRTLVLA